MLIKNYLKNPGPYFLLFDINMDLASTLLFSYLINKIRHSIKRRTNDIYHLTTTKINILKFLDNKSDFNTAIKNLSKKNVLKIYPKGIIKISIPAKIVNRCLDMYKHQATLDKKGLMEVPDSWNKYFK